MISICQLHIGPYMGIIIHWTDDLFQLAWHASGGV